MQTFVLDPRNTRDLSPLVLNDQGEPRVMPASFYRETSLEERALFGLRHGLYGFPTVELVDYLKGVIGGRSAIEIGAGSGVLARALGIRATDNRMQERPEIAAYYNLVLKHPTVKYGSEVEKLDAHEAVLKYRPQVVIACWVTHRYDPANHAAEGNQDGVREEDIIANCETYVFVGNSKVHAKKPIWGLPHQRTEPDWVFSRAANGSADFVATWNGKRALNEP